MQTGRKNRAASRHFPRDFLIPFAPVAVGDMVAGEGSKHRAHRRGRFPAMALARLVAEERTRHNSVASAHPDTRAPSPTESEKPLSPLRIKGLCNWWPGAESKNLLQPAPALALPNSSNPGVHVGVHQTDRRLAASNH